MSSTSIRVCLSILFVGSTLNAADPVSVSKHTTRFTAPVKDGLVDFAEAVNLHFEGGCKPEENSAVILYSILGPEPDNTRLSDEFFARLGMPVPPDDGVYFQGFGQWLKAANGGKWNNEVADRYFELDRIAQSGPWQKGEAPDVARWLDDMQPHLKRLEAAVERPTYFLPMIRSLDEDDNEGLLITVLLPGVYMSRSVGRALVRRAYLAMGEERFEDARRDLVLCTKLGRHVGQGGTLVERLVGVAIEMMAKKSLLKWIELAKPDLKAVAELRAEFDGMLPIPDMAESIDMCERATFLDVASSLANQRENARELLLVDGDEVTIQNVRMAAGFLIDWNLVLRRGNEWYDRMAASLREPTRPLRLAAAGQIESDLQKLATEVKDPRRWVKALVPGQSKTTISEQMSSALVALLLPSASAAGTGADRCHQGHTNLDVALALSAYREDKGNYPGRLQDLVPKYVSDLPQDLFVRSPLKYERTDTGYLLYSLGPNATDEDGRSYADEPSSDDISVRMPVPPPKDDE